MAFFESLRWGGTAQGGERSKGARGEGATEAAPPPPSEEALPEWVDALQRPGELLYVPESWGHATLSLADSVAVAVEFV